MIKDNQKVVNRLQVPIDACTIIVAYLFAYYLRFYSPLFEVNMGTFYSLKEYSVFLVYLVPMYVFIYYLFRLNTAKREKRKWFEIFNVILSNIIGIAVFIFILYILKEFNVSRIFLILFFAINVVLGVSSRMLFSYSIKVARRKGNA